MLGNTLDILTLKWINIISGIGAGTDSFYECLLKTYIVTGNPYYYEVFDVAYDAVLRYLRRGGWYIEANMYNGSPVYVQFNSLYAFWPGMQVLVGDLPFAKLSHSEFYKVWKKYKMVPERFHLYSQTAHHSGIHFVFSSG